jgi:hypothetical protein
MGMPEELFYHDRNVESMNILRYDKGQLYTPHFDGGSNRGSEIRFTSMLVYLSTPKKGGETSFPAGYNADGSQYLKVKAKKRSMIFFYNLLEDGNLDQYSLHAGEPVQQGTKWVGALWTWDPKKIGVRSCACVFFSCAFVCVSCVFLCCRFAHGLLYLGVLTRCCAGSAGRGGCSDGFDGLGLQVGHEPATGTRSARPLRRTLT